MEKNKLIIIALLVIIAALLVGIFALMPNFAKTDSKLEIIGNDTINEGDNLQIKLTDTNGTALANQTINITITDKNQTKDYQSVVTNDEGIGELKLEKDAGEYNVTISYDGNDSYKGCIATKNVTIKEEVVETSSSSTVSDPGAFYSAQSEEVIYTGEIKDAPDGHKWKHLGNNEWVKID